MSQDDCADCASTLFLIALLSLVFGLHGLFSAVSFTRRVGLGKSAVPFPRSHHSRLFLSALTSAPDPPISHHFPISVRNTTASSVTLPNRLCPSLQSVILRHLPCSFFSRVSLEPPAEADSLVCASTSHLKPRNKRAESLTDDRLCLSVTYLSQSPGPSLSAFAPRNRQFGPMVRPH